MHIIVDETNKQINKQGNKRQNKQRDKTLKWILNHLPAYSTLIAVKRVFVYTCKMFAFKTEVLGQSGTTAATGLTFFIYLKSSEQEKHSQDEGTFNNTRFEDKQSLMAKTVSTSHAAMRIACDVERNFCSGIVASNLHEVLQEKKSFLSVIYLICNPLHVMKR